MTQRKVEVEEMIECPKKKGAESEGEVMSESLMTINKKTGTWELTKPAERRYPEREEWLLSIGIGKREIERHRLLELPPLGFDTILANLLWERRRRKK